MDFYKR
jgi:hypothetical protein